MSSTLRLLSAAAAALLLPAAQAVENGSPSTPFGVMDFGAGVLPPPSDIGAFGLRLASYRATQLRDNAGDLAPVKPDLQVDSVGLAFIKMTDLTLGDARFGWGAVMPWLQMKLDLSVDTPVGPLVVASGRNRAQGDLQLIPVILQWTPSPGWHTNLQLQVQLPTGSYDKTRAINAGVNHWTVSPVFAFTWIQASGLELSSNIQLNVHGRNKDTQYRNGIEYQHEFALGQHIGPWTVGLGGYHYQQLSSDKVPAGVPDSGRARVTALGPAVNFFELGSGWPVVWAHAYKEFGARNRSQGTQFTLRAAWTF